MRPTAGPRNPVITGRICPPGVRAQLPTVGLNGTQRDPAVTGYRTVTCGNTRPEGAVPDPQSPPARDLGGTRRRPLTGPQLARRLRERSPEPPLDRHQARSADRA